MSNCWGRDALCHSRWWAGQLAAACPLPGYRIGPVRIAWYVIPAFVTNGGQVLLVQTFDKAAHFLYPGRIEAVTNLDHMQTAWPSEARIAELHDLMEHW
jgi:hypothetical protein